MAYDQAKGMTQFERDVEFHRQMTNAHTVRQLVSAADPVSHENLKYALRLAIETLETQERAQGFTSPSCMLATWRLMLAGLS